MSDQPEFRLDDLDDTDPRKPEGLEERLRREEPPLSDDDTNPGRALSLDERLRREEPPVADDDTSPSLMRQQLLGDFRVPAETPGGWQRAAAMLMLLGAFILTGIAAVIWMNSGEESDTIEPPLTVAVNPSPTPAQPGEATLPPSTPLPESAIPAAQPSALPLYPTAAVDEIAVALLTPAPGAPPSGAVQRAAAPFTIQDREGRTQVIQYTVQSGDTLDSIAAQFGLSDYYSIIWSNARSKINPLRPGSQLNILPEDGVYYEVTDNITIRELAEKYQVDPYTIIDSEYNNLYGATPDTLLIPAVGWIVIPGGKGEEVNLLPANTNAGGGGSGGVISGSYTLWGCTSEISGGTMPLTRPLDRYQFMQDFSFGGHEGVDLSGTIGDPVYAAGDGTVAYAGGNSTGYGNVIVIAHGAYFTVYGHLSSIGVRCGESVSAGEVIGRVGNTGRSSGPHLHFEVRDANWVALSPRSFIGF